MIIIRILKSEIIGKTRQFLVNWKVKKYKRNFKTLERDERKHYPVFPLSFVQRCPKNMEISAPFQAPLFSIFWSTLLYWYILVALQYACKPGARKCKLFQNFLLPSCFFFLLRWNIGFQCKLFAVFIDFTFSLWQLINSYIK